VDEVEFWLIASLVLTAATGVLLYLGVLSI
jgi:hypothetical protein